MFRQIVESMRIEEGVLLNPAWHQERVERTISRYFGKGASASDYSIKQILASCPLPAELSEGVVKCRLLYSFRGDDFITAVQYQPYVKRSILSLKLVNGDPEYSFKYADRAAIEELLKGRGEYDDVIIVKNGLLTDASAANITLPRGGRWYTPATPLLQGTTRARLIEEGRLIPVDITPADLPRYEGVKLINAMLDVDSQPLIPLSEIGGLA